MEKMKFSLGNNHYSHNRACFQFQTPMPQLNLTLITLLNGQCFFITQINNVSLKNMRLLNPYLFRSFLPQYPKFNKCLLQSQVMISPTVFYLVINFQQLTVHGELICCYLEQYVGTCYCLTHFQFSICIKNGSSSNSCKLKHSLKPLYHIKCISALVYKCTLPIYGQYITASNQKNICSRALILLTK